MEFLNAIDEFLLNASQHEFLLVVYGVVVYFSVWYSIAKDKFDAKDKPFPLLTWLRKHSDNIWTAFVVGMGLIIFDEKILNMMPDESIRERYHSLVYALAGPISDRLIRLLKKDKHHHG